ncbi:hypothetical protein BT63DRAFT_461534 [Microthyrium microscopicum]|uniref:Uncharacterized protein n=1 Tax=Microthyrium microscopicum TaxID=703497 RepID=A0A6A6TUN8_9PEZI|nr:hypothetical protein BT63DRAFT_461534 [Microthyrium microscopicum]
MKFTTTALLVSIVGFACGLPNAAPEPTVTAAAVLPPVRAATSGQSYAALQTANCNSADCSTTTAQSTSACSLHLCSLWGIKSIA